MTRSRSRDPFEPERPKRRRRQQQREQDSTGTGVVRKRGKAKLAFVLIVVAILLLPNLVGWLGLQKQIIDYALHEFQGNVRVGGLSLGWFQSISMTDIEVTDLSGEPILTVAKLQSQKSLYSFLIGSDYGEIDIHQPTVFLNIRSDGSNAEDALSHYLAANQPSPIQSSATEAKIALPRATLRVHEGSAVLSTSDRNQTWQIDSFAASIELTSNQAPLAATAQFRAMSLQPNADGQWAVAESGNVLVSTAFDLGSDNLSFSKVNAQIQSKQLPLSILTPLTQRFFGQARMSGNADASFDASWDAATSELIADIEVLQASDAKIYAPSLLIEDNFFLQQVTASGKVQLSPRRLKASQFKVETDLGRIDANGQFDPAQFANLTAADRLPDADLNVEGYLDLAALMQRLPTTFKLHDDITVESGMLQFSAGQSNASEIRRLVVNLDTANIRAMRGNQPIIWQQPLRLVGTVRESGGHLAVESLECVSDFLNVSGSATFAEGVFEAKGDLGKLSERIGQFADLGQMRFGGALDGQFGWKVVENQQPIAQGDAGIPLQIGGEFTITNPEFQFPDLPRWNPNKVVIRTSGSGKLLGDSGSTQLSLSQAGAQMVIDKESSVISLQRPVDDVFTNQQWVLNTQVSGQIAAWLSHIENFVDLGEFDAAGDLNFAGVAILDSNGVRIENAEYELKQLGFEGYGVDIREERVVGSVTAEYSTGLARVEIPKATVQGSGISATLEHFKLEFADAVQMDGQAAWRADINRVSKWLSLSTKPDSVHWYGAAGGTATFKSSVDGTHATFQADLSDVVAAQQVKANTPSSTMQLASNSKVAWVELWREKVVKLSGQLNIADDFDRLVFEQFSARSRSLDVDVSGSIDDLSRSFSTNLEGSYRPDFKEVNALLSAYTYGTLQLEGSGVYPVKVQGPLFSRESPEAWVPYGLTVQSIVGWDRGSLLGLPIGKSEVQINLQQQIADASADRIPVSGGFANLSPRLNMSGSELELTHGQSQVLENVNVTPEICSGCLQYVAPWAAGATKAQGTISAELQGMKIPVSDPMAVSARGSVFVHDLTVDAGPLAQELLGTLTQIRSLLKPNARQRQVNQWLRVESQSIPIAIENRRVYHEGVKFSHDELVIRTSGSVGINDNSLNMVAMIPIADEWIEGSRYLSGLKGQSLSIPVGGTVERPYIDPNRVTELSRELVQNAARTALGNTINDKVNPQLEQFNQKINDKIGGFLEDKLGLPSGGATTDQSENANQPPLGGQIENRINDGLKKGLDKLFGG